MAEAREVVTVVREGVVVVPGGMAEAQEAMAEVRFYQRYFMPQVIQVLHLLIEH
jgi:hypothetical protein